MPVSERSHAAPDLSLLRRHRRGDRVRPRRRGASEAHGPGLRRTPPSPTTSSSAATRAACISSAGATPSAAASGSTSPATPRRSRSSAAYPRAGLGAAGGTRRRDPRPPPGLGGLAVSTPPRRGRAADRPRAPGRLHLRTAGRCSGFAGDTLASALLANGETAGRALVQVPPPARHRRERRRGAERAGRASARAARFEPNARATTTELADGPGGAQPEPLAEPRVRPRRRQRPARRRCCRRASTTRPSSIRAPPGSTSSSR